MIDIYTMLYSDLLVHFAEDMWEKPRIDGKRKLKCNAVSTIFFTIQKENSKKNNHTVRLFILKIILNIKFIQKNCFIRGESIPRISQDIYCVQRIN